MQEQTMAKSNTVEENAYVAGTFPEIGDATCDHHEHEGHGEHGCGHGGCHQ